MKLLWPQLTRRIRWHIAMRFGIFSDQRKIVASLAERATSEAAVLINLGCGRRSHPAWINIDFRGDGEAVFSWDLRKPLPLPDQSCDAIYSSHVIEHFTREDARRLLLECRRLLRPGGCLRLVAPDLEAITRSYLSALESARRGEPGAAGRYEWMSIELLDQLVRHKSGGEMMRYWAQEVVPEESFVAERVGAEYLRARAFCRGRKDDASGALRAGTVGRFRLGGEVHLWMYDDYSLCRLLEECGFVHPLRCGPAESAIAGFKQFCLDTEADGSIYKPDSFFVEAYVP